MQNLQYMKSYYSIDNFPIFVANNGNWNIYANAGGHCASIPTPSAEADGCLPSHFGDAGYVKTTLGHDVMAAIARANLEA